MVKSKVHNMVDPDLRKAFLGHRDSFAVIKKREDAVKKAMRMLAKDIKNDGFTMAMIKDAHQLSTAEGETKFKAQVANRMLAAAYVGAAIGEQLSLFLDEPRVPAVDQAAKDGQSAAMRNEAHAPPYDSSVPQFKAWSDAFYAEQERQVKAGIGKLDAKAAKANAKGKKPAEKPKGKRGRPAKVKGPNAEPPAGSTRTLIPKAEKDAKAAARAAKPVAPPRKPTVAPVTRASIAASKAAVKEEADSYFSKSAETKGNA